MYTKAILLVAVACGLATADAFSVSPQATRAAVKLQSASARAGLAPLRTPISARKLARCAASGLSKLEMAKVKAEYIWVGGRGGGGDDYRSKTRVLDSMPKSVDELPLWNYDGSSTGQAPGSDSEVFLKPAFMCKDPMREGDHILVLCEMLRPDMTPIKESTRTLAQAIFDQAPEEVPWFGIEQEYTLFKDGRPMGWPASTARPFNKNPDPLLQFGYPGPQGAYYCAVGYDVSFGRLICEKHLDLCLKAGLMVSLCLCAVCGCVCVYLSLVVPSLRYTRGLGWRMHCGAEVTESSTNKQHHISLCLLSVSVRSTCVCARACLYV
jgi:hypothetical protein